MKEKIQFLRSLRFGVFSVWALCTPIIDALYAKLLISRAVKAVFTKVLYTQRGNVITEKEEGRNE
jgi:hypothetical protein